MKASEYVKEFTKIIEEHGDLDVEKYGQYFERVPAMYPMIKYRKILKGRQSKPQFWYPLHGEDRKGEKVIMI